MSRLLHTNPRTVTRIKSDEYRAMHAALTKKRNKYRAKRTKLDDKAFASKHESRVYARLKQMERAGFIKELRLQPKYPMTVNGHLICTYISDFEFKDRGKTVTVDAKGARTRDYIIKRKLFLALYSHIEHREA